MSKQIQPISSLMSFVLETLQPSILFRVRIGGASGDIIYTGRAALDRVTDNVRIVVNDIIAPYIRVPYPEMEGDAAFDVAGPWTFVLEFSVDGGASWSTGRSWDVWPDWSYRNADLSAVALMTQQVGRRISSRQPLLITALNVTAVRISITGKDGTPKGGATASAGMSDTCGTAVFDLSGLVQQGDTVDVFADAEGGVSRALPMRYTVAHDCIEGYALYWLNDRGGWDFLLLPAAPRRIDNITRHAAEYHDAMIHASQPPTFANEIRRSLVLSTGWLGDEASWNMRGLFTSIDVRLYDIAHDVFRPLVLTADAVEYKTYVQNGGRLNRYEITADIGERYEVR